MTTLVLTGPADLRDSQWLDEQSGIVMAGIDTVHAVREAALSIFTNWHDGRQVSRFHSGMTAGEYIASLTGNVRLPKPQRNDLITALTEQGMSTREVARAVGVGHDTVATVRNRTVDPVVPDRITSSNGKSYPRTVTRTPVDDEPPTDSLWDDLSDVITTLRTFAATAPTAVARAVPERRRQSTARALRDLGTYLGRIALSLEENA